MKDVIGISEAAKSKIMEHKMQLNELRKLAGIPLTEGINYYHADESSKMMSIQAPEYFLIYGHDEHSVRQFNDLLKHLGYSYSGNLADIIDDETSKKLDGSEYDCAIWIHKGATVKKEDIAAFVKKHGEKALSRLS